MAGAERLATVHSPASSSTRRTPDDLAARGQLPRRPHPHRRARQLRPVSITDASSRSRAATDPCGSVLARSAFDLLSPSRSRAWLRRSLGLRTWRAVHWLAYACWPIASCTRSALAATCRARWMLTIGGICLVAVLGAVAVRAFAERHAHARGARVAAAAAICFAIGLALWVPGGPLGPHWARRAGPRHRCSASRHRRQPRRRAAADTERAPHERGRTDSRPAATAGRSRYPGWHEPRRPPGRTRRAAHARALPRTLSFDVGDRRDRPRRPARPRRRRISDRREDAVGGSAPTDSGRRRQRGRGRTDVAEGPAPARASPPPRARRSARGRGRGRSARDRGLRRRGRRPSAGGTRPGDARAAPRPRPLRDDPRRRLPSGYVAGQETALVASSTAVPPSRRSSRVFETRRRPGGPTLVDNVETLAHIALIARHGADWFRELGHRCPTRVDAGDGGRRRRASRRLRDRARHDAGGALGAAGGVRETVAGVLLGGYWGTWLPARQSRSLDSATRPGRGRRLTRRGLIVALPAAEAAPSRRLPASRAG